MQVDHHRLPRRGELGLASAKLACGAGHGQTLAGPGFDQVGLEPGDHGQDVERQAAIGVAGVVDGAAQLQPAAADGELLDDVAGLGAASASQAATLLPGLAAAACCGAFHQTGGGRAGARARRGGDGGCALPQALVRTEREHTVKQIGSMFGSAAPRYTGLRDKPDQAKPAGGGAGRRRSTSTSASMAAT